ncbi:MAG: hypothetical protein N0E44_02535 [Candidatus Thiodiazotropha lotti]|nr:hypothetical protein [Candidatus Thiodiazotropha lotti]MCW4218755.1 hypothetical protein [Candidatus Thiodiazotropha lotti]
MTNDPFHQIVSVFVVLGKQYSSGEINRIMKESGATLHYDVYGFERAEKGPVWQSESYIYVALFCDGNEVDAQESVDKIELQYPMATIGSEYISKFADTVVNLSSQFDVDLILDGKPIDKSELIAHCENLATELMREWGEEPGSETLRILIEQNYS